MRLSDIMGNAGLSIFAEIALVLFFAVYIAIIIHTWAPSRRRELHDASMLPLNDEPPARPASAPRTKED